MEKFPDLSPSYLPEWFSFSLTISKHCLSTTLKSIKWGMFVEWITGNAIWMALKKQKKLVILEASQAQIHGMIGVKKKCNAKLKSLHGR